MNALRTSHAVWLMRRSAVLDGTAADAGRERLDPARGAALHRIAARIGAAAEDGEELTLSPADRTLLVTEAQALTARASEELKRAAGRDLQAAEEWVRTARAFREILQTTREDEGP